MKKLINTYFSEDIVSAVFALVIFMCVAIMVSWHIALGIRGAGLVLELLFIPLACLLVRAVYKENKEDSEHQYGK